MKLKCYISIIINTLWKKFLLMNPYIYIYLYTKRFFRVPIKQGFSKTYVTDVNTKQQKISPWYSFIKQRKWGIPIGVGISLLTVFQYSYLRKYPYTPRDSNVYEPINIFVV